MPGWRWAKSHLFRAIRVGSFLRFGLAMIGQTVRNHSCLPNSRVTDRAPSDSSIDANSFDRSLSSKGMLKGFFAVSLVLAVVLSLSNASAIVMRDDFFDPYADPDVFGLAGPADQNGEIQYQIAANDPKLSAIGAITMGNDEICTGTVIGTYTVITAAHCLEDLKESRRLGFGVYKTLSELKFILGPSTKIPTRTFLIADRAIHSSRLGNYNRGGSNGQGGFEGVDLALIQIYDPVTNDGAGGPGGVTPIPLGEPTALPIVRDNDPLSNLASAPFVVGYGYIGYGRQVILDPAGVGTTIQGGWRGDWNGAKTSGTKRSARLNIIGTEKNVDVGIANDGSDVINVQFPSSFDSTSLVGVSAPGDSGGPLLLQPTGNSLYAIVGVLHGAASYAEIDLSSLYGAHKHYARISSHLDWIRNFMYGVPPAIAFETPIRGKGSGKLTAHSPAGMSANALISCGTQRVSVDYSFGQALGILNISLAGLNVGSIDGSTSVSGSFSAMVNTRSVDLCNTGLDVVPTGTLEIQYVGPTGTSIEIINVKTRGLPNGDFRYGLVGWTPTAPQGLSLIVRKSAPEPPTKVIASANNSSATVSFMPPENDGGENIISYTVTSIPDGKTVSGASSPLTVTGLTNGTAYTFVVTATNSLGQGPASVPSAAVTPTAEVVRPSPPTGVAAIAGNASAQVFFEPPTNNGGGVIRTYAVTSNPGGIVSTGTGSPIRVYGLTNGVTYTFTVTATNYVSIGPASAASNAVVPLATNAVTTANAASPYRVVDFFGIPISALNANDAGIVFGRWRDEPFIASSPVKTYRHAFDDRWSIIHVSSPTSTFGIANINDGGDYLYSVTTTSSTTPPITTKTFYLITSANEWQTLAPPLGTNLSGIINDGRFLSGVPSLSEATVTFYDATFATETTIPGAWTNFGRDGLLYNASSGLVRFADGTTATVPCNFPINASITGVNAIEYKQPTAGTNCRVAAASANGMVAGVFYSADGKQGHFRFSKSGFEQIMIDEKYWGPGTVVSGTSTPLGRGPTPVLGVANDGTILLDRTVGLSQSCIGPFVLRGSTITDLSPISHYTSCVNMTTAISGGGRIYMAGNPQQALLGLYLEPMEDATPDGFAFAPRFNIPPGTQVTSNTVIITSVDFAVPISITGGQYSIDGGPLTNAPGFISNGQRVSVTATAPVTLGTQTTAVLTIGGATATFVVSNTGGRIQLSKTGQINCYDTAGTEITCSGTRQDGATQAGAAWPTPRFTDKGDNTVSDNLTGLIWTKIANLPLTTKTWQQALDYVAGMNAGIYANFGHTDWRLPNLNELKSIIDSGANAPALPSGAPFTAVQNNWYWSSTTMTVAPSVALIVNVGNGQIGEYPKTANGSTYYTGIVGYMWPVRSGVSGTIQIPKTGQTTSYATGDDGALQKGATWPSPRFTDNGNDTVTDNLTGIMWTKNANLLGTSKTWQESLDYIVGMNNGTYTNYGYTDWRLSNRIELESLLNIQTDPFLNISNTAYQSSTTVNGGTAIDWVVDPFNGGTVTSTKMGLSHVWPIRGGVLPPNATTSSSANPSQVGQSVTFTVSVSGQWPSGTVQFKDGAVNLGSAVILSEGSASYGTTALAAGSHLITAVYSGDVNNAAITSAALLQNINQHATVPGAPTIGTVNAGNASASVNFTPPASNGGATITGYTATCTPSNGGVSVLNTGGVSATSIQIVGLTNGKSYTCTVTATNSAGTSAPSAVSTSVTPTIIPLGWTRERDFPVAGMREALYFAIGAKGYVGITQSSSSYRQFWEYDPAIGLWSRKADLPNAGFLFQSPSFVIGKQAYIVVTNQTWAYDQDLDQWTRKQDAPGTDKRNGFGFAVGAKGYVGGGFYNGHHLWEYDAGNDQWRQKADHPVLSYGSNDPVNSDVGGISFTIGNKAYITGTNFYFWDYDPNADQWTKKSYVDAVYGVAYSIGDKGYVWNTHGDLYQYITGSNKWDKVASFPGNPICSPVGFSVNGKGFIGLGAVFANNTCTLTSSNELWSLTLASDSAPVGSLAINNGAATTASPLVTLNLNASDNNGVIGYYATESSSTPSIMDGTWSSIASTTSYSADVSYTLSSGTGTKTIYVWFKDMAGNVSLPASASITLAIQASTITTVNSSANPSVLSQSVTFTATVTGQTPSGTAQFKDGASNLGSAVSLSGGSASYSTAGFAVGSHSITAVYSGDMNNAVSTSVALMQTVNQPATVPGAPTIGTAAAGNASASVSFTAPASNGGATITQYRATASPGGATATGTVSPITVTGLTNGTAYTFTVTATNSVGTSLASAASNSVTPTATADTIAPTVPLAVTASAVSSSRVRLSWNPSTDNVGVTKYNVYRNSTLLTALTGTPPATNVSDPWLAANTGYSYTIVACDAAANCSAPSTPVLVTTLIPSTGGSSVTPVLGSGFNQIGNSLAGSMNVATILGNKDEPVVDITTNIVSAWKWNAVDQRWAFYSPQLTAADNAAYAASHNYDALTTVNPGEGVWMNATNPITLPAQSGTAFTWNSTNFATLPLGFNLIATANAVTPSQFNNLMSQTPPSPGTVPTNNFVSLWMWDAVQGKWYFYSPLLEASGGLSAVKAYADSHNYLHFQDSDKTIGIGTGFWVNRP